MEKDIIRKLADIEETLNIFSTFFVIQLFLFLGVFIVFIIICYQILKARLDNEGKFVRNAFLTKAHIYDDSGDYEKLLEISESRLEDYNHDINALWYRAKSLYHLNNYSASLTAFNEIKRIDPAWNKITVDDYIYRIKEIMDGPKNTA